jgi:hypothetical protein
LEGKKFHYKFKLKELITMKPALRKISKESYKEKINTVMKN